jgi:integrase
LVNAKRHLRTVKSEKTGQPFVRDSLISICSALNEYMRILLEYGYITEKDTFTLLLPKPVKKKRAGNVQSRKRPIYTVNEVYEIKKAIDRTYEDGSKWKQRAYGIFFGVCTGLRSGNIRGLKPNNLYPDANPPHFETGDNVISGSNRGISGTVVLEFQTKTFEGSVKIPFVQPDVATLVEVASYLKKHVPGDKYILTCFPTTVGKWWRRIARDCKFRWVNPHNFKHGYATRGAQNLQTLYQGNPHFLQWCCLHSSYDTTQRYIDEVGGALLDAFRS